MIVPADVVQKFSDFCAKGNCSLHPVLFRRCVQYNFHSLPYSFSVPFEVLSGVSFKIKNNFVDEVFLKFCDSQSISL